MINALSHCNRSDHVFFPLPPPRSWFVLCFEVKVHNQHFSAIDDIFYYYFFIFYKIIDYYSLFFPLFFSLFSYFLRLLVSNCFFFCACLFDCLLAYLAARSFAVFFFFFPRTITIFNILFGVSRLPVVSLIQVI